jgi:serine/threonine-protein kinase
MAVEELSLADRVEVMRNEQRQCWLKGERVVAETYFALHPRLLGDPTSALQMVYNEVLLREAEDDGPRLVDYIRRFPQFTDQLTPLFEVHRALESDELLAAAEPSSERALPRSEPEATGPWPTVAGHEILGELGRGGMGVVYKARQVGLNRIVALKMILAGNHAVPAQLARFRAEAEAVARLHHPNIVQIHDVGEQDGRPYFSLEFVDGGSLAQELNGTPQPARPSAGLIQTLARAMHAAHQKGIVHRDLKPANVLLQIADCRLQIEKDMTPVGRIPSYTAASDPQSTSCKLQAAIPKITDFGLAKHLDIAAGQTGSGMVLGTPSYMAPEQADSKAQEIGPAADVYALGAIL